MFEGQFYERILLQFGGHRPVCLLREGANSEKLPTFWGQTKPEFGIRSAVTSAALFRHTKIINKFTGI